MTRFGQASDDEPFEVTAAVETVIGRAEFEGANVCRVAALSTRLGDDSGAFGSLAAEFRELGFSDQVISPERRWRDGDATQLFLNLPTGQDEDDGARIRSWQALNETGRATDARSFLVSVLGSPLERESAAAAAALWRQLDGAIGPPFPRGPRLWHLWDRLFGLLDDDAAIGSHDSLGLWPWPAFTESEPSEDPEPLPWDPAAWDALFRRVASRFGDPYTDPFLVALLVRWRIARALRSSDPVTVSFAMAAFEPARTGDASQAGPPPAQQRIPPGALVVSTMIHGTWGWKGDWWRPRSPFHEFILRNHRPNLYSRGAKYSWSGALREGQRIQAAGDFCDWAYDVAPNGLQTVFAHSYGGEVAARAVLCGARVTELVLLSVPVTDWVEFALPWIPRVVDVRLRFDPVLGLAQTRQRIAIPAPNTTIVLLDRWRYAHGATHEEHIWRDEDIARRAQL